MLFVPFAYTARHFGKRIFLRNVYIDYTVDTIIPIPEDICTSVIKGKNIQINSQLPKILANIHNKTSYIHQK